MFYRPSTALEYEPCDPDEERAGFTRDAVCEALSQRFQFRDEVTRQFATDVLWRCVLPKIQQPTGLIRHRWLAPGRRFFNHPNPYWNGYIWDTAFMADVLSWMPGTEPIIAEVFRNYWEWVKQSDALAPEPWRRGSVWGISPTLDKIGPSHGTQLPLFSWGIHRCFQHSGDRSLIEEALPCLDAWHDWLWEERSLDGSGLCVLGSYDGTLRSAKDESYDWACDMDDLALIPHPKRPHGPRHYGNIWNVGFTSYVIRDEEHLAELATIAGDTALAGKWRRRAEQAKASIRERLWHEEKGTFCCRFVDSGEWVDTVYIGSWMALYAGVPTTAQAERMADTLSSPEWMTPLPIPTVGRTDPKWEPGSMGHLPDPPKHTDSLGQAYNFWRGDCWPPTSYHVASGLQRYGYHALAARIADATIMNALRWGDINERYDCDTGKPLGVADYGMSACVFAMMADGQAQRFAMTAKEGIA